MKKMFSLVLALMILFSLALPVSATALDSPEEKPSYSSWLCDCGTWNTGKTCTNCGKTHDENPKTGDVVALWVGAMTVSATGLAAVMTARKKEQ